MHERTVHGVLCVGARAESFDGFGKNLLLYWFCPCTHLPDGSHWKSLLSGVLKVLFDLHGSGGAPSGEGDAPGKHRFSCCGVKGPLQLCGDLKSRQSSEVIVVIFSPSGVWSMVPGPERCGLVLYSVHQGSVYPERDLCVSPS